MYDEENKKEYPVQGTVTISTEEYKDLLNALTDKKMELERKQTEYWEQYRMIQFLEKQTVELGDQLKLAKEELQLAHGFIASDQTRAADYFTYRNNRSNENVTE